MLSSKKELQQQTIKQFQDRLKQKEEDISNAQENEARTKEELKQLKA